MNVDYNFHDVLGLRLVDPTQEGMRFTARQLDPLVSGSIRGEPDVRLTAVHQRRDELPNGHYRLGNAGDFQECAFDESHFWLLDDGGLLSVPFDTVGQSCEIRYDARLKMGRAYRYTWPVLQLSLLSKEAVAVHAAAILYNGQGILFAGWAESGKTEAMLAFVQQGASFVSDKWTIVTGDGSSVHSFPAPITVRAWAIAHLPALARNLTPLEGWRLRLLGRTPLLSALTPLQRGAAVAGTLGDVIGAALDVGGRVSVPPTRLFRGGVGSPLLGTAPLSRLFFMISSLRDTISVSEASVEEIAQRLADCAQYERRNFLNLYTKFRFALPGRRNRVIEECREREIRILSVALQSKKLFVVEAPFPFNPMAVYDAIARRC